MSILNINRTVPFLTKLIDPEEPTLPVIELPHSKPTLPIRPSLPALERCTPEEEGIPTDTVAEYVRLLKDDSSVNIHGVMILRNGRVIFETAIGAYDINCPRYVFSCSKSFISIAIGMLFDEGKLSPDENIESIFPDKVGKIAKISRRTVTVEDLLTMTSGASFNEAECVCESDWTKAFITSAALGENGRSFNYNSMNTYMLSAIITRRTGVSVTEYLRVKLFEPLGITDIFWEKGPEGPEKGGWGLYCRAEDLAKVGIMMLQKGVYNGKRLLSEEYVKKALTCHAEAPESYGDFNYGYQIWVGRKRNDFLFNGMLGQNMYINADNRVIAITFAGNSNMFQQSSCFKYTTDLFGVSFPDSLPFNKDSQKLLNMLKAEVSPLNKKTDTAQFWHRVISRLLSLLKIKQAPQPVPEQCKELVGKTFAAQKSGSVGFFPFVMQIVHNSYATGIDSISFAEDGGRFFMIYKEKKAEYRLPIGFSLPEYCDVCVNGDMFKVGCFGKFHTDIFEKTVLEIRCDFIELPSTRSLRFVFENNGATLIQGELPGKDTVASILRSQNEGKPENKLLAVIADKLSGEAAEYKLNQHFEPHVTLRLK